MVGNILFLLDWQATVPVHKYYQAILSEHLVHVLALISHFHLSSQPFQEPGLVICTSQGLREMKLLGEDHTVFKGWSQDQSLIGSNPEPTIPTP